ncbi:MAG: CvpA family protein [Planctomycetota bacterium]
MKLDDEPQKKRMPFRTFLTLSALIFGPAIFFKLQGDVITASVLTVSGMAAFAGYRSGALSIFALFGSATIAFWFAPSLGMSLEDSFSSWFGTTGLTNRMASILGIALAIVLFGAVLSLLVRRRLRRWPKLTAVNQWGGFSIGAIEGGLVMFLLLGGILMIEPRERERAPQRDPQDARGQMISRFILRTSAQTRQSLLGPTIVRYNPFKTIPQLSKFDEIQDTVQVLKDPNKIQSMLYHPSIRDLQKSPEVQRAVDELHADPEVAQMLRSQQIDGSMAVKLMNHPALLNLIDQPGFLDRATSVIRNLK